MYMSVKQIFPSGRMLYLGAEMSCLHAFCGKAGRRAAPCLGLQHLEAPCNFLHVPFLSSSDYLKKMKGPGSGKVLAHTEPVVKQMPLPGARGTLTASLECQPKLPNCDEKNSHGPNRSLCSSQTDGQVFSS